MKWSAWQLSARLAWGSWLYRILTGVSLLGGAVASALFIFFVIPLGHEHGTLVVHYNVYLGIDDVRIRSAILLLPLAWLVLTIIDLIAAYGVYRRDRQASLSLLVLATAACVPWTILFYYLTYMNR